MQFTVLPAHLEFEAIDRVYFPSGQETNVFRSAFGNALKRVCGRTYARTSSRPGPMGPAATATRPALSS